MFVRQAHLQGAVGGGAGGGGAEKAADPGLLAHPHLAPPGPIPQAAMRGAATPQEPVVLCVRS